MKRRRRLKEERKERCPWLSVMMEEATLALGRRQVRERKERKQRPAATMAEDQEQEIERRSGR